MNTTKRLVALICFCALGLTALTSCSARFYEWVYGTAPWSRPMSKWTADGIELYVLKDCGPTDEKPCAFVDDAVMIVHYGDTEMVYDVKITSRLGENGYGMYIRDIYETTTYVSDSHIGPPEHYFFYYGDIEAINDTKFAVTLNCPEITGGGYDIPELMFPEEITFALAAENLTESDIPKIEKDEQYEFCPTYREYSEWISNDLKMTLYVCFYSNTDKRVKCRLNDGSCVSFYVNFFESNSSAFLTEITEENRNVKDVSLIVNDSGEQWQCEYFEDHFVATVIRSEHYEVGQVWTFNLLPPFTYSEAMQQMQHWWD